MTKNTNKQLTIELAGNKEIASWVAHYKNFCYPEYEWVLCEIQLGFYGVGPRELWIDTPSKKPDDPIPLSELRKSFNTSMLNEINWSGVKHEFWDLIQCRVKGLEDNFSAFLVQSRFPLHKVEAYLKSLNDQ